jgi:hypothetical protein
LKSVKNNFANQFCQKRQSKNVLKYLEAITKKVLIIFLFCTFKAAKVHKANEGNPYKAFSSCNMSCTYAKIILKRSWNSLSLNVSMERSNTGGVQRMAPGSGTHSYALNSWVQSLAIKRLHPILRDAINHFKLPKDGNIRVADLGCSIGANTLTFANIISTRFFANGASEVQYFFNDLPTNDFNTLFQQIPPLNLRCGGNDKYFDVNSLPLKSSFGRSTKEAKRKIDTRTYYAVAVPGSFYERLFPSSSLHLVLSTNSLHWISHVSVLFIMHLSALLVFHFK